VAAFNPQSVERRPFLSDNQAVNPVNDDQQQARRPGRPRRVPIVATETPMPDSLQADDALVTVNIPKPDHYQIGMQQHVTLNGKTTTIPFETDTLVDANIADVLRNAGLVR